MPRPATWIAHVPEILEVLEKDSRERLGREDVEKLFGVSASRAKEIIAIAGGKLTKKGFEKTVLRAKLLDYVKFSREAQDYRAHLERKVELAKKLARDRENARLRAVPIAAEAADRWTTLDEVLPRLGFDPGVLRIVHDGTAEDLIRTIYRLGQGLGGPGEFERFSRMVEERRPAVEAMGTGSQESSLLLRCSVEDAGGENGTSQSHKQVNCS